jgi:protein tyrosine phosphatase
VPFDATRVVLETPVRLDGDDETSDFINASFISDVSSQTTLQNDVLSALSSSTQPQLQNGGSAQSTPTWRSKLQGPIV